MKKKSSGISNVEYFIGDLSKKEDCNTFVEKTDIIIHLAHSFENANDNLRACIMLLEAINVSKKPFQFIYPSSGGSIYGISTTRIPFKETDICRPTDNYGKAKYKIEQCIKLYSDNNEYLDSTILRISNPYGKLIIPRKNSKGFIGTTLYSILNNLPVKIFGNGEMIRDYIHSEDLCIAFAKTIKKRDKYEVYNIGSSKGHSLNDVLNIIRKYSNINFQTKTIINDEIEKMIDWNVVDIAKARQKLNWTPKINLNEGLKKFILLCSQI